jgi:hypothetical protein
MPTDPTPFGPTRGESSATDRAVRDRAADATEEMESDGDRTASDPGGDREAALERRVTELEAELEAVRGLLDGVEAINETVDQRASTALAKVEALEERLEPEARGLVRERLPEADDGERQDGVGRGRTGQRGDPSDLEPDPATRPGDADSRIRDENGQDRGRHADTANSPGNEARASTGTAGTARPPTDANAADGGSAGAGAISSVGSAAPDQGMGSGADDDEQTFAARLRDAFR